MSNKVAIDVWAPWCAPCIRFAPIFEAAADRYPDISFVKINADEAPEAIQEYGVMSIPTLILLKDGEVVAKVVGAMGEETLDSYLDQL